MILLRRCFTHRSTFGHLGTDLDVGAKKASQPDDLTAEFDTNDAVASSRSIFKRSWRGAGARFDRGEKTSGDVHRRGTRWCYRPQASATVSSATGPALCATKSGLCCLARTISSAATTLVSMNTAPVALSLAERRAAVVHAVCRQPARSSQHLPRTESRHASDRQPSWCSLGEGGGGAPPSPHRPRLPLLPWEQLRWDAVQRIVQHVRDWFAAPLRVRL
jgi:hypothetical protein